MIGILLSVLYVTIGYLYSDVAWNTPEIKAELEELRSIAPPEMINGRLAAAKILIALLWPVFFFGSIFAYTLQALGIIKPGEEDE
ncbi:hypothetical protein LCGC14_1255990 [marine sediment metagenome]|uniref:Uncharacterized protein n=1 Tax=marine sediment metagenome TaxID=412755 RepID=A0A0F9L203_9ZZZZ